MTPDNTPQSAGLTEMLAQTLQNTEQGLPAGPAARAEHVYDQIPEAPTAPAASLSTPPACHNAPVPPEPRNIAPGLPGGPALEPARPPMALGETVDLVSPVELNGRMINELTFRAPNFGDWMDCGEIFTRIIHDPDGDAPKMEVKFNFRAIAGWFNKLTGHNASLLRKLSPADGQKVIAKIGQIVEGATPANPQH